MFRYVILAFLFLTSPAAAQFSGGFTDNGGSPPSTPSGAAGGDLSGSYPNPTYTGKVNGSLGQTPGTTTNDSATAGNIGEYVSSTVLGGAAVAISSSTPGNVTSISLTAGDWDVSGNVAFAPNAATLQTVVAGWISTTSATIPTAPNNGSEVLYSIAYAAGAVNVVPVGTIRLSLGVTTTVYLTAFSTFSVNSNAAYGHIHARRVR